MCVYWCLGLWLPVNLLCVWYVYMLLALSLVVVCFYLLVCWCLILLVWGGDFILRLVGLRICWFGVSSLLVCGYGDFVLVCLFGVLCVILYFVGFVLLWVFVLLLYNLVAVGLFVYWWCLFKWFALGCLLIEMFCIVCWVVLYLLVGWNFWDVSY